MDTDGDLREKMISQHIMQLKSRGQAGKDNTAIRKQEKNCGNRTTYREVKKRYRNLCPKNIFTKENTKLLCKTALFVAQRIR